VLSLQWLIRWPPRMLRETSVASRPSNFGHAPILAVCKGMQQAASAVGLRTGHC